MAATLGSTSAQDTMPPLVKQINNGNWLDQTEAESLRAQLFYQHAVYAYMTMLPALNVIGMRDGSEAEFGAGYNVLPIWKDRMDSRTWVPTPNADVIYSMSYSSAPAMVMRTTGAGSKYPYTIRDADGDFLEGGKSYKLRLPPNPPAGLFWAVTAYNVTDGTMPETDQLLPSTNGYYNIPKKADGSIEIWFGPKQPEGVANAAFIKTIPGRNFVVCLRLYGAEDAFYDQTWKPDDVVKMK